MMIRHKVVASIFVFICSYEKLIKQITMCWGELYATVTLITSSHIKHMHEIMRNPSDLTLLPWQPKAIKSTSYELLHLSFLPHPSEGAAGRLATLRNKTHNLSRYLVCDGAYGIYDSSGSFQRDQNKQKWCEMIFFCSKSAHLCRRSEPRVSWCRRKCASQSYLYQSGSQTTSIQTQKLHYAVLIMTSCLFSSFLFC